MSCLNRVDNNKARKALFLTRRVVLTSVLALKLVRSSTGEKQAKPKDHRVAEDGGERTCMTADKNKSGKSRDKRVSDFDAFRWT